MILMRFIWFRRGLAAFLADVDAHRREGWEVAGVECHTGLLGIRWLCVAHLRRGTAHGQTYDAGR